MPQLNKYAGVCDACKKRVWARAGYVEKQGYGRRARWAVWCVGCYNRSDNSGPEDRCCGDRAYEDASAAACGCNTSP